MSKKPIPVPMTISRNPAPINEVPPEAIKPLFAFASDLVKAHVELRRIESSHQERMAAIRNEHEKDMARLTHEFQERDRHLNTLTKYMDDAFQKGNDEIFLAVLEQYVKLSKG